MNKLPFTICLTFLCLSFTTGCGSPKPPVKLDLTEAQKKFIAITKDEYGITLSLYPAGKTLWIYVPLEESFFEMKAADTGAQSSQQQSVKPAIHYLQTGFNDDSFMIDYDIGPLKSYMKSYGYDSTFTKKYQETQRNLMTAVYRSFIDIDSSAGEFDFFIIVIADIKNGIAGKTSLYVKDLLRGMSDASFYEEYTKRLIQDYPVGSKAIIGDKEGRHLDIKELTWEQFIAQQINYRVNYKYTRSAFSPSDDPEKEILQEAANTFKAYDFSGYKNVILKDMDKDSSKTISREDIGKIKVEETPEGKYHVINFFK